MGFREPDLHLSDGVGVGRWRGLAAPSSMAALPKLNCNARRSALERGPKPHVRLEPVAKPRKRGTLTGALAFAYPTDWIHAGGSSPGSSDAEACAPSGSRLECSAEARSRFGSTRRAGDRSRSNCKPTLTSRNESAMSDRSEATGPLDIPTEVELRVEGTLLGSTELKPYLRPGTSASTHPCEVVETARLTRGTTEAITARQPHSLASEQEQRVHLSTTSPDCE